MAEPGKRHPDGFTLLEVLVALVVIGLLIVSLVQGIHFGLLAWDVEARLTGRNDGFSAVDNALRHIVERADPGEEGDAAPFIGSPSELQCITALPGAGSGSNQVTLVVDAGHRLVLRWRPYVRAIRLKSAPPVTETKLLSGISRIELSYWQSGSGWVSTWRSADLPGLVRFRLVFATGEDRHWPDIIAAPMLDRR
jgi:general secretion pathway protein J